MCPVGARSEEHTSELQSPCNLVSRLLTALCCPPLLYTTLFRSEQQVGLQTTIGVVHDSLDERGLEISEPSTIHRGGASQRRGFRGASDSHFESQLSRDSRCVPLEQDRKSTRLNSSHHVISYPVFSRLYVVRLFSTRRSSDLSSRSVSRRRLA